MSLFSPSLEILLRVKAQRDLEKRQRRERERKQAVEAAQKAKTIWIPNPGPQTQACKTPADIIGYGGQAGGGKTDLITGLLIKEHHTGIIFRRYYTDLKDIVKRAKKISEGFRTGFNGSDYTMGLPGERELLFGAMAGPDDWERFKGRARDAMWSDEVTEFLESQVRSDIAWVRTTIPGQRRRVIFTFNPPTNENGEWVIRFFAPWLDPNYSGTPALPGELRWFAMIDGVDTEVESGDPIEHIAKDAKGEEVIETIYPMSRTFIPARLEDNPFLHTDGEYRRMLQSTPEPLRSQLLYGKFDIEKEVNPWQVLPTAWVEAAIARGKKRLKPNCALTAMGVDVAHGGKDRTVIAKRYGDWVGELLVYPGKDTPDGKAAAKKVLLAYEVGAYTNVDAIGYGASCAEKLMDSEAEGGYELPGVSAVNVGAGSTSKYTDKSKRYKMKNKRAEAYWRLRELLDPDNDSTFCLPDDPQLKKELCAPTWEPTPGGILVESKLDIAKRIKVSTDLADAVVLSVLPGAGAWLDVAAAMEELSDGDEDEDIRGDGW